MKTNSINNTPEVIENLGDDTYYYNFNVDHSIRRVEESNKKYDNYDYDQVRLDYPVDKEKIQVEVDKAGFDHTVKISGQ